MRDMKIYHMSYRVLGNGRTEDIVGDVFVEGNRVRSTQDGVYLRASAVESLTKGNPTFWGRKIIFTSITVIGEA